MKDAGKLILDEDGVIPVICELTDKVSATCKYMKGRVENLAPRYRNFLDKMASNYVHKEASYLGNKIEKMYVNSKSSFIRDAVFGNYDKLEKLVRDLKDNGYEVHLIGVATDYNIAMKRANSRFERSGRYLDPEIAKEGHKGASDTFGKVISGPLKKEFAEIKLYDGNSDNGIIYDDKILNEAELHRFLKKKDLK